ncbi:MAG: elongation factor P [Sulfurospirillum sp.]|nr:elongation factor P [Sulfurospirillum sp.]MBL0702998.1 elongation factor P [Sulfurospirillum sp.]
MATIGMSDLKKGLKIELNGVAYKIIEYQHVKPGKGAAFVRAKIKSYANGKVIEKTFHAGDKCKQPNLEDKTMQYLYDDGEMLHFMDTTTYDQISLTKAQVGDATKWIIDGMNVEILFHNGNSIGVDVKAVVELKVIETPPNFKGDSQGGKKPATLESGAVVQVPFHIIEGNTIRVDTIKGEYLEKIK